MVYEIKNQQSYTTVMNSSYSVVLIDIYADWCGPCKYLAPKLEELSKRFQDDDILFCKLNTDTQLKRSVKGLPTIEIWVRFNRESPRELHKTIVGADLKAITETLDQLFLKTEPFDPTSTIASRQRNFLPPAHELQQRSTDEPQQHQSVSLGKPKSGASRRGGSYKTAGQT